MSQQDWYSIENHPGTIHHTYTGNGCAVCGKVMKDHSQENIVVNGEKIKKEDYAAAKITEA